MGQLGFFFREIDSTKKNFFSFFLDEVGHIHGHLIDTSVVEFFNIVQSTFILVSNKIDGNAFTAKATTTADSENLKNKNVSQIRIYILTISK